MSLGLQISIEKVADEGEHLVYRYFTMGQAEGRVKLAKATGNVTLIEASPDDRDELIFSRVAFKLQKHWRSGEMPDQTWWTS
jgi:hypothetical protein